MVEIEEGIFVDGQDYVCFYKATLDGKDYLYLTTLTEPYEIHFAEVSNRDGEPQIRMIGNREKKVKLMTYLQANVQPSA